MAVRVSNLEGLRAKPGNYLLIYAMGPNVAGVIDSAIGAGVPPVNVWIITIY